jgi:hypothetical protein
MGASAVVAGAAGGEEGYASETLPDLIIGDLSLPVMDARRRSAAWGFMNGSALAKGAGFMLMQ